MRASLVGRACKLILKAEHARSENKTLRQQSTSRPSHRPSDDDSDARRRRPGKVPVRLPAACILRSRFPLDAPRLHFGKEARFAQQNSVTAISCLTPGASRRGGCGEAPPADDGVGGSGPSAKFRGRQPRRRAKPRHSRHRDGPQATILVICTRTVAAAAAGLQVAAPAWPPALAQAS